MAEAGITEEDLRELIQKLEGVPGDEALGVAQHVSMERQAFDSRAQLLWRCFKLTAIDNLQQLESANPCRNC
jgi:hypothetical protein